MARVTVEDCLKKIPNRFILVILAAKRAKQILKGSKPLIDPKDNKPVVVALREVAAGKVQVDLKGAGKRIDGSHLALTEGLEGRK